MLLFLIQQKREANFFLIKEEFQAERPNSYLLFGLYVNFGDSKKFLKLKDSWVEETKICKKCKEKLLLFCRLLVT
jgi:hypothetical protein